ncbi:MAG: hypothetical protein E5X60_30115 [Mesorhizobium sp.]|nr:MAG: hypothetical protein E5X60_30115 [Mesorhizobium sp.]
MADQRLRRGATFAAKTGRMASPPPRRRTITNDHQGAVAVTTLLRPATVDFSALAARAATTRIAPEKEAAVAAILDKVRSFRAHATDTAAFDRNLSVVEDILPGALDG